MAMNAALIKVEALALATGETIGISATGDRIELLSSSKSFSTDARRIAILRRIVPLWDGLRNATTPFFFFTYETQNFKHAFLSKPKMSTFQVCIFKHRFWV
jgi:hypothetical protein